MTEAFKREKVFRDPVHDYIHVKHPLILELINDSAELNKPELPCILSIQQNIRDSLTL